MMERCPVCGPKGNVEQLDTEIRNCLNCKFMWNVTLPNRLLATLAIAHVRKS